MYISFGLIHDNMTDASRPEAFLKVTTYDRERIKEIKALIAQRTRRKVLLHEAVTEILNVAAPIFRNGKACRCEEAEAQAA